MSPSAPIAVFGCWMFADRMRSPEVVNVLLGVFLFRRIGCVIDGSKSNENVAEPAFYFPYPAVHGGTRERARVERKVKRSEHIIPVGLYTEGLQNT